MESSYAFNLDRLIILYFIEVEHHVFVITIGLIWLDL